MKVLRKSKNICLMLQSPDDFLNIPASIHDLKCPSNAIMIIRGVSVFLGHVKFNLINDEAVTFYSAVLSVSYFAPKMRLPFGLGPQTSFSDNLRGNRQSERS